jgi:hypothetical protein
MLTIIGIKPATFSLNPEFVGQHPAGNRAGCGPGGAADSALW